jgi:hypothetical protein
MPNCVERLRHCNVAIKDSQTKAVEEDLMAFTAN